MSKICKTCNKCNVEKDANEFYKCRSNKDGLQNRCKACISLYYDQNKLDRLVYAEQYRTTNAGQISKYLKQYAIDNAPHLNEYYKQWSRKNRKHLNGYIANYYKDPIRRLDHHIGTYIGRDLKKSKAGRKWESLVGYTIVDLKHHLESKFKQGMRWDNYGEWHVDHITPRSHFIHTGVGDPIFKECWAISNLQPLWETDNLSKGNRFVG